MAESVGDRDETVSSKIRAIESAPIGITIADARQPDNPLIFINDAFETITGYSKEEMVGRNCRILQGEATDPSTVASLREGIEKAVPTTVILRNYRSNGEPFWNEVTVAPLRDEAGEVTHFVGFQVDVTARISAEKEVTRRADQLERLLERIHGLLQDITELLMRSVSRKETEHDICQRILAADPYSLAAIGEQQPGTQDILITSVSGMDLGSDGEIRLPLAEYPQIERALASDTVTLCTDGPTISVFGDTCVAIAIAPLVYGSQQYGVLIVGTDEKSAFDRREIAVIDALGRTIAIAINAAQSQRILAADNVVELEFLSTDRGLPFVDIAANCACLLEYEGSVPGTDGTISMFFTTTAAFDSLADVVENHPGLSVRLINEDHEHRLVAFDLSNNEFIRQIVERGGELTSLSADEHEARILIESLKPANPRSIIDWLTTTYPDTELVAFRERERPPMTKTDFIGDLEENLTDRQQTAITIAYTSGYYDPDRSVTGDELAEIMGITRATYHQHLRAAERKVIGEFFEE